MRYVYLISRSRDCCCSGLNDISLQQKGAGLGVPLASRMIDLMGGSIVFQSAAGSGTSVKIEVPLSIDTEGTENSSAEETDSTEVRLHLMGFKSKDGLALSHMAASLKRQLRVSQCSVVRILSEADAVLIEEQCDLRPYESELLAFTSSHDKQIVLFGAATSPKRSSPPKSLRLCGEEVPVRWIFRPLLPSVVDQILSATRARCWDSAAAAQNAESNRNQMINPDTTTTESDSEPEQKAREAQPQSRLGEPSMSDPNIPDLKHKRPLLVERRGTSQYLPDATAREGRNESADTGMQAAFKGRSHLVESCVLPSSN